MAPSDTPPWVWALLVAAVFGVSSAGALFQSVDDVPPLLQASWRLQLTAIVLFPFFLNQLNGEEPVVLEQLKTRRTMLLLLASGAALAAHFGAWVASLGETTLTHSLLFVTANPLVIVMGMAVLAPFVAQVRRPLKAETGGAVICFVGAGVTLLDTGSDQGDQIATVYGDALAFAAAVFVVGYIVVGRILRTWMPIFVYAFPVTLIGALLLLVGSWFMEPTLHTGLNTWLRYISPLVVSISVTMEPVLGSIIGWVFFDTGVPGFWTRLGGLVLMAGLCTVVVASERASLTEANNQNNPS